MIKKTISYFICILIFEQVLHAKHHHHHKHHHVHQQPSTPPEECKNFPCKGAMKFALVYAEQAFLLRNLFELLPGTPSQLDDLDELKTFTRDKRHLNPNDSQTDPLFLNLYQKNNLALITPAPTYIIPPIIHQVWIGHKSRERFEQLRQTWMAHHPGWLYKLWTDEDVKKLKLINQAAYDQAKCYAHKADILRYELLFMFGGVYADMDTQCIQPFDVLNRSYEFYVGLCDPQLIVNSLIGSVPGHPILRYCIETIKSDPYADFVLLTGPTQLTKSFKAIAPSCNGRVIAFPGDYFNPMIKKTMRDGATTLEADLTPETFAIHGWAASWVL